MLGPRVGLLDAAGVEASPPAIAHERAMDALGPPVSGASHRLRALADLSGSLTDALGPEEAARFVEQKALSALGAVSAVVMTLGDFPGVTATAATVTAPRSVLRLVHAIRLPEDVRLALQSVPLDSSVPMATVARTGAPNFLPTEAALADEGEWGAAMLAAGVRAAAVVPVWANGELRGVLGLAWESPRDFDEDERAFVLTLGVMCAQAIMRAHLRAAELTAREQAERANQSKAHFLATISHELRTPMNAVIGYTELVAEEVYGPISDVQRDHLRRARNSGRHLLGLIEDLLGYARIEAGEEIVRCETVLLRDVVDQSLELVQPLAERKGLLIRVEHTPRPIELHTDGRKVRQVLVNLLANAVKFTDTGDVLLVLRIEGHAEELRVIFEVTDTGAGIALEHQEHIFHAFWQKDPLSTHTSGSTGLGLSVARELARMLGGDVTIARSQVGRGSTFILSLPARYQPQAAVA